MVPQLNKATAPGMEPRDFQLQFSVKVKCKLQGEASLALWLTLRRLVEYMDFAEGLWKKRTVEYSQRVKILLKKYTRTQYRLISYFSVVGTSRSLQKAGKRRGREKRGEERKTGEEREGTGAGKTL